MAEQRQPFRFRFPWLTAATPRPTPEPQPPRPTPEIQAPAQPTTSIPIQRVPFRPAGIAPTLPPPQTQPAPRREPLRPSSYRAPTESRIASQPASPSRAPQTRASSVPLESRVSSQPASPSRARTQTRSPSRASTQSRAASVPPSPSRTASQSQPTIQADQQPRSPSRLDSQTTDQKSSQPSSPMRKPTQVQPTTRAVSQASSPSKKSQPSTQDTSQPPVILTLPPSSVTPERELKPARPVQLSQEPQPRTQIKSEIVSESQFQSGGKTIVKPDRVAAQPTDALVLVTAALEKLRSVSDKAAHRMALSESEKKLKETDGYKDTEELVKEAKSEDGKKVAGELVKEEKKIDGSADAEMWRTVKEGKKTDGSADEEMRRTITKFITGASPLETQSKSKDLLRARIQTEERKQEMHEIFERKKPPEISISDEKHIKTVNSTHQRDRNILGNHQKPHVSNGERAPLHKGIREDISKFVHKLATGRLKQPMDDRPASIITVAGENRGASMHLGSESAKKDGSGDIHRGYKLKSDEIPETTTDGEGSSKGRSPRDPTTKKDQARKAYINNNTQSINDSILFDSSVAERNSGVHMIFSRSLPEPTKAEFSVTPAEKLTSPQ